ncbi:MAG: hypothetical protein ACK5IB_01530 [Qingshengfaniella sp.]
MERALMAAVMLWLAGATPGAAGAWLRETGRAFVSLSYEVTTPRAALSQEALAYDSTPPLYRYTSVWAEYGLTDWLTLGLDAGRDEGPDTWTGVIFARLPLMAEGRFGLMAAELGIGQRRYIAAGPYDLYDSHDTEQILRLGLSWGKAFAWPRQGGWLAMDTQTDFRQTTDGQPRKLDLTFGLRGSETITGILQLQTGDYPRSRAYAKLLTSVVYDLPWGLALETGALFGLREDNRVGMKTSLWWRF